MTLTLPHGVRLRLGWNLEARFPLSLPHLTNPKLRTLLVELDPTPDSLRETGATDWADSSERLHFIIDLIRCYQEASDLLQPPFMPEQNAVLRAGRIPAGEL